MPELPEVETTCSGIRPHLAGTTIVSVDVLDSRLRWPVAEEVEQLSNKEVLSVTRRAKYILIEFEHGSMICHLGMSGSLRIVPSGTELKKHDHLCFHLSTGVELRYHDPRRFGCALFAQHPLEHDLLKHQGPEPLTEGFDTNHLYQKAKQSNSSIKQFIMNNKVVVGVGNIYACESLFLSGISPKKKVCSISRKKLELLVHNIKSVLARAIEQGGTTLKDFVNQDGKPGYFQQQLYVYNREGEACKTCGTPIKRIVLGQRSTFYCTKCQK